MIPILLLGVHGVMKLGRDDSALEENGIVNIGGLEYSEGRCLFLHCNDLLQLYFHSHIDIYVALYDQYHSCHDNSVGEYYCYHCDDLVNTSICSHFNIRLVLDSGFLGGHDNFAGEYVGSHCYDLV